MVLIRLGDEMETDKRYPVSRDGKEDENFLCHGIRPALIMGARPLSSRRVD